MMLLQYPKIKILLIEKSKCHKNDISNFKKIRNCYQRVQKIRIRLLENSNYQDNFIGEFKMPG